MRKQSRTGSVWQGSEKMAVYNLSLMAGYEVGGVDSAMGFRCKALESAGLDPRFLFMDFPTQREYDFYEKFGIKSHRMTLVSAAFSDCGTLQRTVSAEEIIQQVSDSLNCDEVIRRGNYAILARDHLQVAGVIMDNDPDPHVVGVQYMNQLCIIRVDYYTDYLYCTEYFSPVDLPGGLQAVLTRRSYWNRDHSVALEELHRLGQEAVYIFPNGDSCNRRELINRYFRRLKLTEADTLIIDRPQTFMPQEALFTGKANIITVFHSEHMYQRGCSTIGVGLNREYYYWFRNSDKIRTMVVSTEEQKRTLAEDLRHHGRKVPDIRVIPVAGIPSLQYPEEDRKPCSVICASRLEERKKVTWAIQAVVKAHEKDPRITMDIYGNGSPDYMGRLTRLIAEKHAEDYIRLMGFADLSQVYQNYELMLTTSLWETLGITSMEAAAAGCAIVGFDVRYGNRVFIDNGRNGFLVDYCPAHSEDECPPEVDGMADRIVEVFADEDRLRRFHERSYEIAEDYLSAKIEQAWVDLVKENG